MRRRRCTGISGAGLQFPWRDGYQQPLHDKPSAHPVDIAIWEVPLWSQGLIVNLRFFVSFSTAFATAFRAYSAID